MLLPETLSPIYSHPPDPPKQVLPSPSVTGCLTQKPCQKQGEETGTHFSTHLLQPGSHMARVGVRAHSQCQHLTQCSHETQEGAKSAGQIIGVTRQDKPPIYSHESSQFRVCHSQAQNTWPLIFQLLIRDLYLKRIFKPFHANFKILSA